MVEMFGALIPDEGLCIGIKLVCPSGDFGRARCKAFRLKLHSYFRDGVMSCLDEGVEICISFFGLILANFEEGGKDRFVEDGCRFLDDCVECGLVDRGDRWRVLNFEKLGYGSVSFMDNELLNDVVLLVAHALRYGELLQRALIDLCDPKRCGVDCNIDGAGAEFGVHAGALPSIVACPLHLASIQSGFL